MRYPELGRREKRERRGCPGFAPDQQVFTKITSVHSVPIPLTPTWPSLNPFSPPSVVTSSWMSPRRCHGPNGANAEAPGPKGVVVANSTGKVALATPGFGSLKSHHPWEARVTHHHQPPPLGGQGSGIMHFCFSSMFPPLSCTFGYPGSHCTCPSPPKPLSLPRGTICTTHSKKTLTKRALKFSESLDPCGVTKCRSGSWSRRD